MALGAIANYLPAASTMGALALLAAVYALVNGPSVAVWAMLGSALRNWTLTPGRLRIFNTTMAVLLLASLYPLLTAELG